MPRRSDTTEIFLHRTIFVQRKQPIATLSESASQPNLNRFITGVSAQRNKRIIASQPAVFAGRTNKSKVARVNNKLDGEYAGPRSLEKFLAWKDDRAADAYAYYAHVYAATRASPPSARTRD